MRGSQAGSARKAVGAAGKGSQARTTPPIATTDAAPLAAPSYADLVRIVELIRSASRFSEFRLRSGDIEIEIRRTPDSLVDRPTPTAPAAGGRVAGSPAKGESATEETSAPAAVDPALRAGPSSSQRPGRKPSPSCPPDAVIVRSPMVGTFYRAPLPGAEPFVEPGRRVEADTVVCIIEVMKLMNSIPAGCAGTVTEVLVGNAEPVEYAQPLIVIDPRR